MVAPLLGAWLASLSYGWLFALTTAVNLVALVGAGATLGRRVVDCDDHKTFVPTSLYAQDSLLRRATCNKTLRPSAQSAQETRAIFASSLSLEPLRRAIQEEMSVERCDKSRWLKATPSWPKHRGTWLISAGSAASETSMSRRLLTVV